MSGSIYFCVHDVSNCETKYFEVEEQNGRFGSIQSNCQDLLKDMARDGHVKYHIMTDEERNDPNIMIEPYFGLKLLMAEIILGL